jgi:predicted AlkP superfamily phosphohydrolase/phosphomutase
MSARVLVVGLDAGDPTTARELAADGRMPTLARLLDEGTQHPLTESRGESYVAERWTSLVTGVGPEVHRYYCWADADPERWADRRAPLDPDAVPRLWDHLSRTGRRVAVIDVPRQPLSRVHGIQLCDWGTHDRIRTRSWPRRLTADLDTRFGQYPMARALGPTPDPGAPCDVLLRSGSDHRSIDELRELVGLLRQSVDAKTRLSEDLLTNDEWDLFFTVFGETHCAAHQFWHLRHPARPREHEQAAHLGDVVADTFERLDASLARHLDAVGPAATVVVVLHTGMMKARGGNDLLPAIAARLAGRSALFRSCEFTNNVGTIRFRVAGRDVDGEMTESSIASATARLTDELLALIDHETGASAVHAVRTRAEVHPGVHDDALPDLFVEWNGDHVIREVSSPTIGTVTAPRRTARSSDHTSDGLVLVRGPTTVAGAGRTLDPTELAPMIAAMLGVDYETGRDVVTASTSSA